MLKTEPLLWSSPRSKSLDLRPKCRSAKVRRGMREVSPGLHSPVSLSSLPLNRNGVETPFCVFQSASASPELLLSQLNIRLRFLYSCREGRAVPREDRHARVPKDISRYNCIPC